MFKAPGRGPLNRRCCRLETCLFAEHAGKAASPRVLPASSSHTPSAGRAAPAARLNLLCVRTQREREREHGAPRSSRAALSRFSPNIKSENIFWRTRIKQEAFSGIMKRGGACDDTGFDWFLNSNSGL